ncbi:hypothetical protein BU23DRAFT_569087 [Bimuria novae-zelandiae CBS 107.79]|uniref:Piwi domain-containing protein n=1 Tax=Bimuria novae-zelandiae CBS 107.79 TaxID=1447943 RepID=A0A6A5V550_9PLEO|nr:hypothetical protein BU23DRAFT_569087 [Bimuria novae-zelandiae CBS 107.79]
MGADVFHPGIRSRERSPSIACALGSRDANFMRYRGSMRLQAGRQEKIEDMQSIATELLEAWRQSNGQLQEDILFYRDGQSENGNLEPGLLVDKVVTNRLPYNIFLQSHQAIQGTARSTHYHVLEDEMDLGTTESPTKKTNLLTELTHFLCFAFSRATKGVSYVAPAYMADRFREHGNVYLRA